MARGGATLVALLEALPKRREAYDPESNSPHTLYVHPSFSLRSCRTWPHSGAMS